MKLLEEAKSRRGTIGRHGADRVIGVPTHNGHWLLVVVVRATRGLAVHHAIDDSGDWRVTHVASGLGVARFRTRKEAERGMRRIASLADWTGTAKQLADRGVRMSDIQRAVERAR